MLFKSRLSRLFLQISIVSPCISAADSASSPGGGSCDRIFIIQERYREYHHPFRPLKWVTSPSFPRDLSTYKSIYGLRSFRFCTFRFRMASAMWVLTVFVDIFRCSAISRVVQSRAASMAITNSVVVKLSATSWPVFGL